MGMHVHWCLCTRVFMCACMFVETHNTSPTALPGETWLILQGQTQKLLLLWSFTYNTSFPLCSALIELCSSLHILIYHIQINRLNVQLIVSFKSRDHVLFIFILHLQNTDSQHSAFVELVKVREWPKNKTKTPKKPKPKSKYKVLLQSRPYSFEYTPNKLYSY